MSRASALLDWICAAVCVSTMAGAVAITPAQTKIHDWSRLSAPELAAILEAELAPNERDAVNQAYRARARNRVAQEDLDQCPEQVGPHSGASIHSVSEHNIPFAINSNQLTPNSEALLGVLAMHFKKEANRFDRYVIEGHTDSTGSKAGNLRLSCERAAKVRQVLREKYGIAGERLEVLGMADMTTIPGLLRTDPKNRRITFRRLLPVHR